MFSKLMKWLSSDRNEEPREIAEEVSSSRIDELRGQVVEQFQVFVEERAMRDMVRLIQKRQKIEAIKQLRLSNRRLDLKQAKDIADHLEGMLKKA
jgi:ribosomal protein L7/L12